MLEVMKNKNAEPAQKFDPLEGISTDEIVESSRSCDVEGVLRFFCPYCDQCFDSADALRVHLDGDGGED